MPQKAVLNIRNEYEVLLLHNCEHGCQSGGKATQWTADPFYPGPIPGSGLKVFSKKFLINLENFLEKKLLAKKNNRFSI